MTIEESQFPKYCDSQKLWEMLLHDDGVILSTVMI